MRSRVPSLGSLPAPARTVAELLELPYSFSQLSLLMPEQFVREAEARGVRLRVAHLEAFHRYGLLTPFARVKRDGRRIAALARSGARHVSQVARWHPTDRAGLQEARDAEALFDPRLEGFVSRQRLRRQVAGVDYRSSEYLYSHHQLLALPLLRKSVPLASWDTAGRAISRLDVDSAWLVWSRRVNAGRHAMAIALTALEPVHYVDVMRRVSLRSERDFPAYERWRARLSRTELVRWMGVESDWLEQAARDLLTQADQFDPLGDWVEVVRLASPERWKRLRGEARSAMDLRIAAEMFLRAHEDLVRARRARPLAKPQPQWRSELHGRLRSERPVDTVLTNYGLSPHPSLVLVVEGDTEMRILPRIMDLFNVRRDEDFIALQNAGGVGRDLSPLVAYMAPRTEREESRYLELQRPATRILFVADAEGPLATRVSREERREVWVDRLVRTFAVAQQTPLLRDAMDGLVYIEVWRQNGLSFEFAHFTDRQLAVAIDTLDDRPRQSSLTDRVAIVARIRAQRGNLDEALGRISKLDLADELWPVLERRINMARQRDTHHRIPVVRVLAHALDLARGVRRSGVIVAVDPRQGP